MCRKRKAKALPEQPAKLPPIRGWNFPESYVDRRVALILGYSQRTETARSKESMKVPGLSVVSENRRGILYRDDATGFQVRLPWDDGFENLGSVRFQTAVARLATQLGAPCLTAVVDHDQTLEMEQDDVLAAIAAAGCAPVPAAPDAPQDEDWSAFTPPDASTICTRIPDGMSIADVLALPELAPDALSELPTMEFDRAA